jgi:hypothetical protein
MIDSLVAKMEIRMVRKLLRRLIEGYDMFSGGPLIMGSIATHIHNYGLCNKTKG